MGGLLNLSRNVNENPCNMCMPMGAILALKGIEQSMVIIHGSQGCSTYMRRHIAEHYNEPIDVGSSSLNEKGTIYGGEKNLKQALDNICRVYHPRLVGVITTCLAETIGEDIHRITEDYLTERKRNDLFIVTASTPGYGGSHTEGYRFVLRQLVEQLVEPAAPHEKINLIVGDLSTADIRELQRLLALMDIQYVLLPDVSDTLDRPYSPNYDKLPSGGTKLADICTMSGAMATLEIGITMPDELSAGKVLEDKFGVPLYQIPVPIGIDNTDCFFRVLTEITGKSVPESVQKERGRLLDAMVDSHKYNFEGRSVIFGEPDLVYSVTKLCCENGIYPVVVATGSPNSKLSQRLTPLFEDCPQSVQILCGSDFASIREVAETKKANLAIGHSDGRYLEERSHIPLVRLGFPIHDRTGGQRLLSVGYTGSANLLDRLTNTLLENKYKTYRRDMYEAFYQHDAALRGQGDEQ